MKIDHYIRAFTREGCEKLNKQYTGTRQAMKVIAGEKVQEFMRIGDVGLSKEDRSLLASILVRSMMQGFSLGYGVGRVEGIIDKSLHN